MCTRFVYRGDNIITGFNFDIDIVEWNHKIINTKDCFYIGIMRPDGMRHSYHGVNRNGNVGTLLYVHGNLSGTYQDSKDCITIADLSSLFCDWRNCRLFCGILYFNAFFCNSY